MQFFSFLFICGLFAVNAAPSGLRGMTGASKATEKCVVRPELVTAYPNLKESYETLCGEADCSVTFANYCISATASTEDSAPPRKMAESASIQCVVRPELLAAHPNLKKDYETLCGQSDCAVALANYCIPVGSSTGEMAPPRKMIETVPSRCGVRPELIAAYPHLKKAYEAMCGEPNCASAFANYCTDAAVGGEEAAAPPRKMAESASIQCVVRPELLAAHPNLKKYYEVLCGESDCAVALANYCIPAGAGTGEMAPHRKMVEADAMPCVVRPELVAAYPRLRTGYEVLCAEPDCAESLSNYCIPRAEA